MGSRDEIERWYRNDYDTVYHTSAVGAVYRFVYKFMEKPNRIRRGARILEVGAGSGNYRQAARPDFTSYTEVDLRAWNPEALDVDSRVERIVGNAEDLDFAQSGSFDRLVATCLLIHLDNPRAALTEWKRVVRDGGVLTIYVPPEAGMLVRLVRRLFLWPRAQQLGYNAASIAHLEHRYSFFHLDALIREVFSSDHIERRSFPVQAFKFDLNLFHAYQITLGPGRQAT